MSGKSVFGRPRAEGGVSGKSLLMALEELPRARQVRPGAWVGCCPAHDDRTPSLSWTTGSDGRLLVKCHAGCTVEEVVKVLGYVKADLYPPTTNGANAAPRPAMSRRIVETYGYIDETGTLLYQVVRYDPKDFRQRRPDGEGGWIWNLEGIRRVLYRLPVVLASSRGVVVVEGERDADRLAALGYVATCNVGGAGKWRSEYAELLRGRIVAIIPDNDESGRQHAADVARSLFGIATETRVLDLPGLPPKGDVSDWLDTGHSAEELQAALLAAPLYVAGTAVPAGLRFYSPRELASMATDRPEWVVGPGLLALGAITEVDGKIKAAGKTTLMLHVVAAVLDGLDFLGAPTRRCQVIYVTEQSRQTFSEALRRAGLANRGDELRILFREDIGAADWPQVVAACRQDGYEVVVFDTIGKLAGIRQENDAGEWSAAMSPVQDLAASGRAVGLCRHDRKGGGDVGESGRGSSQASGDVDIILALRRPEGHQPSNRRVIEALSRYEETPDKIVVELTPGGYALLGTDEAVAAAEARSFVSAALVSEFQQTGNGLTTSALVELGKEPSPKVTRWAIQDVLTALFQAGDVVRSGAGKARDPYVYSPADLGSAESAETQSYTAERPADPDTRDDNQVRDMTGLSVSEEMDVIFGGAP